MMKLVRENSTKLRYLGKFLSFKSPLQMIRPQIIMQIRIFSNISLIQPNLPRLSASGIQVVLDYT